MNTLHNGGGHGPDLAGEGQSLLELVKAGAWGQVVEDGVDGVHQGLDGGELVDEIGRRGDCAGGRQG